MARGHTQAQRRDPPMPDREASPPGDADEALTGASIHRVLRDGSLRDRQALVDRLPAHPLKGTVRALMGASSPCAPVAALATLALHYSLRSDPDLGATLASALRARARELAGTESARDLRSITLARLALAHSRALVVQHGLDDVSTPLVIAVAFVVPAGAT